MQTENLLKGVVANGSVEFSSQYSSTYALHHSQCSALLIVILVCHSCLMLHIWKGKNEDILHAGSRHD
jgi:hypothetical protein